MQILGKISGKLLVKGLYQCLLGYITQHFCWMYKTHAFRNVTPWNLVVRHRRFGRTCCRLLSGRRVTFLFKAGGIEFVPGLVHVYETTRRHIPEHNTLKSHHRAHIRSQSRYCPLSAIYLKGVYMIFHYSAPLQFPCDVILRTGFINLCVCVCVSWNQVFVMVVCNNKHK